VLYGAGARLFHAGYDRGWRRVRSLPVPVISVGNLTAGGTGKTPAVLALARALQDAGHRPAILTRGYGGRRSRGVLRGGQWEDGTTADVREAGDEPLLLCRSLPAVPVVIGANRAREGARLLAMGTGVDVILMDDGFQHRALARDRDLVLVDGGRPLGNGRLLPAGPLREPPPALARADRLLVAAEGPDDPVTAETDRLLRALAPAASRSRVWPVFRGLVPLGGVPAREAPSKPEAPEASAGQRLFAVAAIARPERFQRLLEREGAVVAGVRWFRDHHRFSASEIAALERAAAAAGARPVTTAKDAVRLEGSTAAAWLVAGMALEVDGGWETFVDRALGLGS
jgi:tetraacyldisaccharide 4'-kinase